MARYFGKIGFGLSTDQGDGIWTDGITERDYQGDIVKDYRSADTEANPGGTIALKNRFSVIADAWTMSNYSKIRYLEWSGVRWTVTSVEVQHPRLLLSIGEVYNGPTA